MINSTKLLNELVENFCIENANNSISQITAIVETCRTAGIKFSFDRNYEKTFNSFTQENFPDFNHQKTNQEIEFLAKQNKHQEATNLRDIIKSINKEIHSQVRLKKYGTKDWFISKYEKEISFLPTQISVIDNLIFQNEY